MIKSNELDYQYGHTRTPFNPEELQTYVMKARKLIFPLKPEAIVCRGMSGAEFAFPLSMVTSIPVAMIRSKKGAHSLQMYEGVINFKTYIVVDDFIETGATMKKIKKAVLDNNLTQPRCLATLLYQSYDDEDVDITKEVFGPDCTCILLQDFML